VGKQPMLSKLKILLTLLKRKKYENTKTKSMAGKDELPNATIQHNKPKRKKTTQISRPLRILETLGQENRLFIQPIVGST